MSTLAWEYQHLEFTREEILALFAHNWPGNIRELERVLFEKKAGLPLREDILSNAREGMLPIQVALMKEYGDCCQKKSGQLEGNFDLAEFFDFYKSPELFNGVIPLCPPLPYAKHTSRRK